MRFIAIAVALLAPVGSKQLEAQQEQLTRRQLYERVVYAMVQLRVQDSWGTGWLLQQPGRPLVVTNRHVVARAARRPITVKFYQGAGRAPAEVAGSVRYRSANIDLALVNLSEDPPTTAQPLALRTSTQVYRGEEIVLGGNPADYTSGAVLPFQTTGGVVTGHVSGSRFSACGAGRNCVVIDAASLNGSSGGPAFNRRGQLVGMLWGDLECASRRWLGPSGKPLKGRELRRLASARAMQRTQALGTSSMPGQLPTSFSNWNAGRTAS